MTFRISTVKARALGDQQFVEAVLVYLRRQYAKITHRLSDREMSDRIRVSLRKAERYGIHDERGQLTFVDMMFTVSPNFDEHPTVHAILTDIVKTFPPVLDRLDTDIEPEIWDQIKAHSPPVWKV